MTNATATPADESPTTPEAALIRYHVDRLRPVPTAPEMAARLGWSVEKWGNIVRGRARARRSKPPVEHHPSAADLVLIAVELGITEGELREAGRADAADRLRSSPRPETAQPGMSDADRAAVDLLFAAFAKDRADRHDRDMLEFLWRELDGDGNLRPLAERVRNVANWLNEAPGRRLARPGHPKAV